MAGVEAIAAIQLIDACIGITKTIIDIGLAVQDARGLPPKLRGLCERLPAIEELFKNARDTCAEGKVTEANSKSARPILQQCEQALGELVEIFRQACPQEGDDSSKRIWKGISTVLFGRDSQVKKLLVVVQDNLKLLEQKEIFRIGDRLNELKQLTESLAEDESGRIIHTGAGNVLANQGGTHTNYLNSGDGRQINNPGAYYEGSTYNTMHIHHQANCAHSVEIQASARDDLKKWAVRLSFPNMDRRRLELQHTLLVSGTCEWLFNHERYKAWEANTFPNIGTSVLVIEGKAGSGKSTLMRKALARAETTHPYSESICISYFFDAAKNKETSIQICPEGLYRSILCQLLENIDRSADVLKLIDDWGPANKAPQEEVEEAAKLKSKILGLVAKVRGRTIRIFIDALDECGKGKSSGKKDALDILEFITRLRVEKAPVLALLSVRSAEPFGAFLSWPSIEISYHNRQDILDYLESSLGYSSNPDLRSQLIAILLHRSSNVFLWVKLVVERINLKDRGGHQEADLKKEVDRLPGELKGIYVSLLEDLDSNDRSEALILLQLVQVRMRPLSLPEIRSALEYARGTDAKPQAYDLSDEKFEERIRRICRGFIEIEVSEDPDGLIYSYGTQGPWTGKDLDESPEPTIIDAHLDAKPRRLVQFTHDSVRDFLHSYGWGTLNMESSQHSTASRAHLAVSRFCMRTVRYGGEKTPFLPYASQFWTVHARNANEAIGDDFQPPEFVFRCDYNTKRITSRYKSYSNDLNSVHHLERIDMANTDWLPDKTTMLMLLAFEGCSNLIAKHGERCTQGRWGETPSTVQSAFALALLRGWKASVQAILNLARKRSIRLDPTDTSLLTNGICPLQWICRHNQHEILESIINLGWDTSTRAARLAFCIGVRLGHGRIVELFLDDARMNVMALLSWKSPSGLTVLHYAAYAGRSQIFDMLLGRLDDNSMEELLNFATHTGDTVMRTAELGMEKHGTRRENATIIENIKEILGLDDVAAVEN